MASPFNPGPMKASAVDELNRIQEANDANSRALSQIKPVEPDLRVKLTSYSSSTGSYAWTEQAFDANGDPYDKPNGLTGNSTYFPAYPVGNGASPPPSFPVHVWLRLRMIHPSKGAIYEFDWNCTCYGGYYSGSGG